MPRLTVELEHLRLADAHIAHAQGRIDRVRQRIAARRAAGADVDLGEATLQVMQGTLAAFQQHRALIVRTIDDLRSGRLPGQPADTDLA